MNKIQSWLSKYKIKNKPTMIALIPFILFLILLFLFLNHNDQKSDRITVVENSELRTGPNAAYPVIEKIDKGEGFTKINQTGKWIEVQNRQETKKGWIAGWHTSLNIKKDVSQSQEPLKGKTIVLDPGHGGSDQGASSRTNKKSLEKNYTLKSALELKTLLEKEGAHVKMTRSDDEYVKLEDRKASGDIFMSIHNDSLESSVANGATVYWYKDSQSKLAETLNASIQKKALLSNRGAKQENYQVLRQSKIPAVLLELGYISNPTDETMIRDQHHRHIVLEGVVDGLKQYFAS
ncbi:N-acetylmuramoyl-L-alanine amidase [Staphylococcus lugdunensis]|uniref:Probable cell wall amidase lytH n=2 Tax=Staphylococcus lugdunensis TaxID=28035 RepID=A0A4Q9W7E0_STALU|nr:MULTISPECIES: N-acetylmuramoyl-L-alanine amidase [Staphylococcus]MBM0805201.1 cell wall amidase [Staphylococcus lugdunensis]MCH8661862.1 N-acetylmuramoyl-L-alanine amidase [Staphylococcus lugdunensis]MCH8683389.1 N-acetylmuramoyl-L-alanine amidase [Staphylococcus lugdunensis]MCI2750500.1 N-acetylmuramoyl-L-alanine amidase [Staphylococcus lugdunensis]MCI2755292.1 N-acetylmuramoyl-L-alanine amidase [Staphylococcus lugdunensis]